MEALALKPFLHPIPGPARRRSPSISRVSRQLRASHGKVMSSLRCTTHRFFPNLMVDSHTSQFMEPWSRSKRNPDDEQLAAQIRALSEKKQPEIASRLLIQLKLEGFVPGCATLSSLMLCYAKNGFFPQAQALWGEIINSSFVPDFEVIACLVDAYARMGQYEEIWRVAREAASRDLGFGSEIYSVAISCFGKAGHIDMMEEALKEMVLRGFKIDAVTGNAFVKSCSLYGSLDDMEAAYKRLKKTRILVEKGTIRAMASAYIHERKFYRFGEFLRDVGLQRRNVGNLLWNLLLLSYAANFKMKSLQREFLSMLDAGFSPDLTTFNIRALAFSRMAMFWDLHLSMEHMRQKGILPDLVTYGCVIDAYMERRLGRNLSFVLGKMDAEAPPVVRTDPLVFEVFGKGDFHASSEAVMESVGQKQWTYSKLVALYLRKQYRRDQVFWNY